MSDIPKAKQLLHLVFGGELQSVADIEFKDLDKLDIVGVYPNYASAYAAWKAKAQGTVDNAQMRYFIVHMHRLLGRAAFTFAGSGRIVIGGPLARGRAQTRVRAANQAVLPASGSSRR